MIGSVVRLLEVQPFQAESMGTVDDAIILAGGLGTRMLPASLYVPKEAIPLVDTPILNHLIWEAARAGVSRVHLVLTKRKKKILGQFLEDGSIHGEDVREDLPRAALTLGSNDVEIIPHIQLEAGGVADAISVAITHIEGPFLVLLGDMVMVENHFDPTQSGPIFASSASLGLVAEYEQSGLPCVGVRRVEKSEVSNYGVVEISEGMVSSIVEKPAESEAQSEYVLCGRYLFPEGTAKILEKFPVSEHGELQSIFLLNHLIEGGLGAVKMDHMEMYDSGDPLSWLKAQIDHGLRREDLSKELGEWLSRRLSRI